MWPPPTGRMSRPARPRASLPQHPSFGTSAQHHRRRANPPGPPGRATGLARATSANSVRNRLAPPPAGGFATISNDLRFSPDQGDFTTCQARDNDGCLPGMRRHPDHRPAAPPRHGGVLSLRHRAGADGRAQRRGHDGAGAGCALPFLPGQHAAGDALGPSRRLDRGARHRRHRRLLQRRLARAGVLRRHVRHHRADAARGLPGDRPGRAEAGLPSALAGAAVPAGAGAARLVDGAGLSRRRRRDLQPRRRAARYPAAARRLVLHRRRAAAADGRGVAGPPAHLECDHARASHPARRGGSILHQLPDGPADRADRRGLPALRAAPAYPPAQLDRAHGGADAGLDLPPLSGLFPADDRQRAAERRHGAHDHERRRGALQPRLLVSQA